VLHHRYQLAHPDWSSALDDDRAKRGTPVAGCLLTVCRLGAHWRPLHLTAGAVTWPERRRHSGSNFQQLRAENR
jgi:hypothetical protein